MVKRILIVSFKAFDHKFEKHFFDMTTQEITKYIQTNIVNTARILTVHEYEVCAEPKFTQIDKEFDVEIEERDK